MKYKITEEQRLMILEEYQRTAIDIFDRYKYLLINPELKLLFELGSPYIEASRRENAGSYEYFQPVVVCAIHNMGCIILFLDAILESALCAIDDCEQYIHSESDALKFLFHFIESTVIHEMRHDSQPFYLTNNSVHDTGGYYKLREADADYVMRQILIEDFGCPDWTINVLMTNGYGISLLREYSRDYLYDLGHYYYELIKVFWQISTGRLDSSDNEFFGAIQTIVFDVLNIWINIEINGKLETMCARYKGVFRPPTELLCKLYDTCFVGISEDKDDDYTVGISTAFIDDKVNDEDGVMFTITVNRLMPCFVKDIARYYNA